MVTIWLVLNGLKRFCRIFPDHKIFPPDVQLKTAIGEIFKPVGYVEVNFTYENKTRKVKLYLIKEDNFPLLFGRDWVSEFDIFPHNLKSVYVNEVVNYSDKLQVCYRNFLIYLLIKLGR